MESIYLINIKNLFLSNKNCALCFNNNGVSKFLDIKSVKSPGILPYFLGHYWRVVKSVQWDRTRFSSGGTEETMTNDVHVNI